MGTSITDICNRALSSLGQTFQIVDLNEASPAATTLRLWYDNTRQDLLRAAPWGFSRRQVALTQLSELVDNASPYPQLYKYAYPADALNIRYVTPPYRPLNEVVGPQVDVGPQGPQSWTPSRQWRFIVNYNDGEAAPVKTITSNVYQAIAFYNADVTNPDAFDPSFQSALSAALAAQCALPLTGNIGLARLQASVADGIIREARAKDANESIPTTDHAVDWIEARGMGAYYSDAFSVAGALSWGDWNNGWANMNWAM